MTLSPLPFLRIGFLILGAGAGASAGASVAAPGLAPILAGLAAFAVIAGAGEMAVRCLRRQADRGR